MTNATAEYQRFWVLYDEILKEQGNPFSVSYIMGNSVRNFGSVNKRNARNQLCICVKYLYTKKIVNVGFYFENQDDALPSRIVNDLKSGNCALPFSVHFDSGTRGENTVWVSKYIDFYNYNLSDYQEAIEKSIPIVEEFIKVAAKYNKYAFFDTLPNCLN